jgi:hypothetical protein
MTTHTEITNAAIDGEGDIALDVLTASHLNAVAAHDGSWVAQHLGSARRVGGHGLPLPVLTETSAHHDLTMRHGELHAEMLKTHAAHSKRPPEPDSVCIEETCENPSYGRAFCKEHEALISQPGGAMLKTKLRMPAIAGRCEAVIVERCRDRATWALRRKNTSDLPVKFCDVHKIMAEPEIGRLDLVVEAIDENYGRGGNLVG